MLSIIVSNSCVIWLSGTLTGVDGVQSRFAEILTVSLTRNPNPIP